MKSCWVDGLKEGLSLLLFWSLLLLACLVLVYTTLALLRFVLLLFSWAVLCVPSCLTVTAIVVHIFTCVGGCMFVS